MTTVDLSKRVQFTVDQEGNVTAVVVEPALWQQIMDVLEDADDRVLVKSLASSLSNHPRASGSILWNEVAGDWA